MANSVMTTGQCTMEGASLFNFLIYVEDAATAKRLQEFLLLLKKRFPSRSIMMIEDEKATTVEAMRSSSLNDGVCDHLQIRFSSNEREQIPFLILAHLETDLPTYVMWAQDPSKENVILTHIKQYATKIVFDPTLAVSIKEYARQVLKHTMHPRCGMTDISWFMTSKWRELFAAQFNTPALIDHLFHARIIRITYNAESARFGRHEVPALYFQAWLAAQMNWKCLDIEPIEGNIRLCYERFIHDTVVLLVPQRTPSLDDGAITSVEIESAKSVHILFKRLGTEFKVKVWFTQADKCEIPYIMPLVEPSKEQLVLSELFWRGTSRHYQNMLNLLYQMDFGE